MNAIGSQIGQFLQRKQAEAVLRESETRFRRLTSVSSDWYWAQDERFRFVEITGRTTSKAHSAAQHPYIGRTRWETGLEIVGTTWEEHRAVLEARQAFHDVLFRRSHAGGGIHYTAVSGEPVFDESGSSRAITALARTSPSANAKSGCSSWSMR